MRYKRSMEWNISSSPVDYPEALAVMEARVAAIQQRQAEELCWLLEHPPLYTAGTSAQAQDLIGANGLPVYTTGRGGQYTYHGPGQRIAYLVRDLKRHAAQPDLRAYVNDLEQWIILTLADFGIEGFTREGRVGVWVQTKTGEAKIAALGVRISKWVTSHGIALNVKPNLAHYAGIVPCGIRAFGVTSLAAMGVEVGMETVDAWLQKNFERVFD